MPSVDVTMFQVLGEKAKNHFFQSWNVFQEITETFVKLSKFPVNLEENDIEMLEKFIVLLYDKSASTETVDAARKLHTF